MRKSLLLSAVALMATTSWAATKDSYTEISGVKITGISPDGTYVVGYNAGYEEGANFKSFLYNTTTGTTEWKTEFNTADLDKSGQFRAVNNAGMIAGAFRDKDKQMESAGGDFAPPMKRAEGDVTYTPLTSAAIWKADGSLIKLGMGPHQPEEFSDGTDGAYAIGLNADGSRAVGYIQIAWIPSYPCQWTLNPTSGEYEYSMLQLPEESIGGYVAGISPDGNVTYGTVVKNGNQYPCIWNAEGKGQIINLADYDFDDAHADAVSANGKYLLVHGTSYVNPCILAVYDVTTGELTNIDLPDGVTAPIGYAISDNGDVLFGITSTSTWINTLHYYSMSNGTLVDFEHYLTALEPELDEIPNLNSGTPVGCSSDFSVIAGNSNSYSASPWVLTLEQKEAVMLNTPQAKELFFSGVDKLTFRWNALSAVPEGATVKEYKASIAGQTVTLTPDQAVDGVFTATVNVVPGSYSAYVKAIANTAKGEIQSSPSETLRVSISEDTDWRLFDNWDNVTVDQMGNPVAANDWWNVSMPIGSTGEVIQWVIESYNFENNTPYYTTTSIATQPWSSVLTSRFMDASDKDDFYLSYYMSFQLVNIPNQDLTSDFLDVECSTDGENWTVVDRHCAADLAVGDWNFYKVNLTPEFAGKTYQLRFNAHGEGKGNLKWNIDVVNINDQMEAPAPTGLIALNNNGEAELSWHNTIGAYEVSRLLNSNILTDYCTGSEGAPLITAVDLAPEMTDKYAGKYITSLSCFLFDNPAIMTNQPTQAEAIVYADGVEVSRAKYDRDFTEPYATTIALTTPVQVEKGKTYRIAVRVFDYDAQQTPVYYQTSDEFIPGVTDLFSEDEGKTWQKLSDVYSVAEGNPMGMCIWPIRANITDADTATETQLDNEIIAYNVLCNGEVINKTPVYAAYLRYTDKAPANGAKYAVQAFYRDGRVSPVCEAVTSSVSKVETDRPYIDFANGMISASGNVESIEVFAVNGTAVARTSSAALSTATLADGIYLVRVKTDGKYATRKIAVRN